MTSTILGIGAAALWTAQGVLLTECSDEHTMTRNTAVFLLLFQSSLIIGNLIEFVMLKGQSEFDESTRITLFAILTAIAVSGIALLLIIRKLPGIPTLQKISIAQCGENCRKILDTMSRQKFNLTANLLVLL